MFTSVFIRSAFIFIVLALFAVSCIDIENYPDTPQLSYESFTVKDSVDKLDNAIKLCRLRYLVKDGNGDIGLEPHDTLGRFSRDSLYFNNLFILLYEKKDGKYVLRNFDVPLNYRTPYVENEGFNKSLKAFVEVKLEFSAIKYDLDTIMFEAYIVDRAINKSNIAVSPDIIAKQ